MNFISTRTSNETKSFEEVSLEGLASDGGLYIPISWKHFDNSKLIKELSFQKVAYNIIRQFVGNDINDKDLKCLVEKSYGKFRNKNITPLRKLNDSNFLLELYHGPTLAFKDIALQLLGNIFDYFLEKSKRRLTIIGATSGDTGSAAIDAVKNNKFSNIFILHPHNRISEFQRRQMTTVNTKNVFNIAVKGSFDDCQNIVKKMFVDGSLKKKINLGSINSINWTRIMAQISYYIYAFNKVRDITGKKNVSFSVPTGNFGDAYAGFLAKEKLKIPINKIIVATNSNNILDRFFRTGTYKKGNVYKTISPSMDIQIASNFERLLYDTNNLDGELVEDLMNNFRDRNLIKVSKECLDYAKKSFTSFSINERNTIQSIKKIYEDFNIIVDPHTAIGLNAANKFLSKNKDEIVISLATAHPAKFSESVYSILGINPKIPDNYQDIFKLNEKYEIIDNSYEVIRSYIIKKSLN